MTLGHATDHPRQIFLCYAHVNRDWVERLELNKKPPSTEPASLWIDTDQLYLGDRWTLEAEQALKRATAAILLVSNDFPASPAIMRHEWPIIRRRYFEDHDMTLVFVPIGEDLNIRSIQEKLQLARLEDIESVVSWKNPLPKLAESRPLIREKIISAATEPKEVQRLRFNTDSAYKLKKKLGDGPFTTVYVAYDPQLERDVAIKLLRDGCNGEHFESAVRKVARATDHTNILSLYSAYLDASPPHYAFQYVEGQPLHALSADPLPVRYVRELLTTIGSAISYAHHKKISGLNIKPCNVIVTNFDSRPDRNYFLNINSYSETKFLRNDDWRNNRDDILYLPLEYRSKVVTRSPQVVAWGDAKRADQYRLGVVAYEMLLGPERFRRLGEQLRRLDFASDNWQWPSVRGERKECPQRICDVVDKMISTDPRDRYNDIQDAVDSVTNTEPEIEAVRESYRRLMDTEESQTDFFRSFYLTFFDHKSNPGRFFGTRRVQDLRTGMVTRFWHKQFQALKEAVLLLIVFAAFHEEERDVNILTRIVETHANRKVLPGYYPIFGKVLVEVVLEKDDDADEELRRAWENVVGPGIKYLKEKTEEVQVAGK